MLRVICVNDVYELEHLPRLKTAVKELRTENTVVLLAGDFLAPSLLSSLDSGEAPTSQPARRGPKPPLHAEPRLKLSPKRNERSTASRRRVDDPYVEAEGWWT